MWSCQAIRAEFACLGFLMHISQLRVPKLKSSLLLETVHPSQEDRYSGDHFGFKSFGYDITHNSKVCRFEPGQPPGTGVKLLKFTETTTPSWMSALSMAFSPPGGNQPCKQNSPKYSPTPF